MGQNTKQAEAEVESDYYRVALQCELTTIEVIALALFAAAMKVHYDRQVLMTANSRREHIQIETVFIGVWRSGVYAKLRDLRAGWSVGRRFQNVSPRFMGYRRAPAQIADPRRRKGDAQKIANGPRGENLNRSF